MHIIEYYIQSKYDSATLCEDGVFQNENYVAVIDGVTPKGQIKWNEHSSANHAKEAILKGLRLLKGT